MLKIWKMQAISVPPLRSVSRPVFVGGRCSPGKLSGKGSAGLLLHITHLICAAVSHTGRLLEGICHGDTQWQHLQTQPGINGRETSQGCLPSLPFLSQGMQGSPLRVGTKSSLSLLVSRNAPCQCVLATGWSRIHFSTRECCSLLQEISAGFEVSPHKAPCSLNTTLLPWTCSFLWGKPSFQTPFSLKSLVRWDFPKKKSTFSIAVFFPLQAKFKITIHFSVSQSLFWSQNNLSVVSAWLQQTTAAAFPD